jgi:hypothetical protein
MRLDGSGHTAMHITPTIMTFFRATHIKSYLYSTKRKQLLKQVESFG